MEHPGHVWYDMLWDQVRPHLFCTGHQSLLQFFDSDAWFGKVWWNCLCIYRGQNYQSNELKQCFQPAVLQARMAYLLADIQLT